MPFLKTAFLSFVACGAISACSDQAGVSETSRVTDYSVAFDANHWGPSWSPDGKFLAFAGRLDEESGYQVLEMNLETGDIKGLVSTGTVEVRPQYSPDGTKILYSSELFGDTRDAALYDRKTGETKRIDIPDTDSYDENRPVWAPNGTSIYFDTIRGETGRDIYRFDLDSGDLTIIVKGPGNESYARVSPDGRRLSYRDDFDGDPDLFILSLGSGELQKITDNDYVDQAATWSPDGTWLTYFANPSGDNEIFLIPSEGGIPTRLTSSFDWDFMPVFSPDGRKIAFDSRRSGIRGIYLMDSSGENVEFLSRHKNSTLVDQIREQGAFKAIEAYEDAFGEDAYKIAPFLSPEMANLVQAALNAGRFSDALALADAWLKGDPWTMARDTWTHGPLGDVLGHLALRAANAPSATNLALVGIAELKLGMFPEAKAAFEAALSMEPAPPLALEGLRAVEDAMADQD